MPFDGAADGRRELATLVHSIVGSGKFRDGLLYGRTDYLGAENVDSAFTFPAGVQRAATIATTRSFVELLRNERIVAELARREAWDSNRHDIS